MVDRGAATPATRKASAKAANPVGKDCSAATRSPGGSGAQTKPASVAAPAAAPAAEVIAPGDFVTRAHGLRDRGDRAGALAVLQEAASCHPRNLPIRLELAAALRDLRRPDEAEAVYRAILTFSPDSGHALAGLARLAAARNAPEEALGFFERALERRPEDLSLRIDIGETLLKLNDLDRAEAMLRGVAEMQPLPPVHARARALSVLGRTYIAGRRTDEAASAFHTALALVPDFLPALTGLGHLAVAQQDHDGAVPWFLRALAQRPGDPGLQKLLIHSLVQAQRLEEAAAQLHHWLATAPDNDFALCQLGLLSRMAGDDIAALSWFQRAALVKPQDPVVLFDVYACLVDLGREDEAGAVMAAIAGLPGYREHELLRLRRLEFFCRSMRFDEALAVVEDFRDPWDMPARAVIWAMAVYAGREAWDHVLRLFAERVVPGTAGKLVQADDMLAAAVARAARACGRQEETLALLDTWAGGGTPPGMALRDLLAEEVLLIAVAANRPPPAWVKPCTELRAARSARVIAALNGAASDLAATLLLCTDRAYLTGAIVAFGSMLRHNSAALRHCRWQMVVDADAHDLAEPIIRRLASFHGIAVEVLPAAELGSGAAGLRTSWGNFGIGQPMSEAAYYRILAALRLGAGGYRGRLLYVDSDTCIGKGIDRLLRFDLAGKPLGARLELGELPGIQRAARKLGVPVEGYFNSGVLLLDFAHAATLPCLRRSLEVAATMPEKLSHLDQCALNLAFLGQTAFLPDGCNMFVRAKDTPSADMHDASIVHYLFRPKPWDTAYPTANNARWIDEFCALAEILTPVQMRALAGIPYEPTAAPAKAKAVA